MQEITVLNNQSLSDISVQTTGKAENVIKIAMANNLVPSSIIPPGTILTIPDTVDVDTDIVRYYAVNNILPATSLDEALESLQLNCEEKLYECFKD